MIGNDVVDLELAKVDSNWKRKGYLNKIFTKSEQILIEASINQEVAVWNLWTRKEATYKIWNSETGIRKYNPIQFECFDIDLEIGKVQISSNIYYTKTEISKDYIYTIAATDIVDFSNIAMLEKNTEIIKLNDNPIYINDNQAISSVSKTHHGRFEFIVGLRNS